MSRFPAISPGIFLAALALFLVFSQGASAAAGYNNEVAPVLQKYCYDCHGNGKKKGGLALDSYKTLAEMQAALEQWQVVLRNLRSGEMPPEDEAQPTLEERELLIHWVEKEIFQSDCDNPDPGRVTIRRLNRAEYNNTIRDLLGVEFQPADDFPVDDVGYGFDNIGDVLSLSPVLFEKYFSAAEKILEQAIVVDGPRLGGPTLKFEAEKLPSTAEGGPYGKDFAMALMREGEVSTSVDIKKAGEYAIRARAFGQRAGTELPKLSIQLDGKTIGVHEVAARERAPEIYEFRETLTPGEKKLSAAYINNFRDPENPNPELRDRNLFIDYLEVVGPLEIQPFPKSHRRIFVAEPGVSSTNQAARTIIDRFASRAFRRPVTKTESDRLFSLFQLAQNDGDNFPASIRLALQAVLVSPHFLFRGEVLPENKRTAKVHNIDEYALASRLSYFLWSTMPDEELFRLAGRKQLRKKLPQQVRRMLQDPRSVALVQNFAGQWLQIRNLDHITPAKEVFPEFDQGLLQAMKRETELFFEAIMRENRSVLELLDADFTFVNERLAKHYGLPDVQGEEFRKVSLAGTPRGGVLTHASILTITSNPTRTSPVKRGKWVLENILGTPPPPAPPDVPELNEEKEAVLSGSLRQRMEQHREKTLCASCHARMDPIGFGFENFDGIGAWRDKDGAFAIDPSGKLVTGESFNGPAELKQILLDARREEFLRCLAEKMLTFALGRGVEYYDSCAIDRLVAELKENRFTFETLVLGVVNSVPFQKRRGESEKAVAVAGE